MMKAATAAPVLACAAILALSGCIDQSRYETAPVQVKTPKGTVTCQLYKHNQVLWDEATSVPPGMTIREGDQTCINEGKRRLGK